MKKAVIVLLKCQVPKRWLAFNVFILSDRDIKEGKYFTHANNKDAEQTVHLHSLISAIVIRLVERTLVEYAICKILIF